jgi:type IV pilus biogenesis protein CpaD/CtpE
MRSRPARLLVVVTALAALSLSGCSQASGQTQGAEPCSKTKYDAMYFAVDPSGTVVKFPEEELESHQRRGFRPASQEQAQTLVRRECPAGFR